MDDLLLTASSLALLLIGVGGALAIVVSAVRRRDGRAWIPAGAAVVILLSFTVPSPLDLPLWAQLLLLVPWFVGFPLLAATFPDGRFVPHWSVWFVIASGLVLVADAALGDEWRRSGWWGVVIAGQLVPVGFIVYRYRRSASTTERESVRWVLLGLVVSVSAFAVIALVDGVIGTGSGLALAKAAAAITPLITGLVIGLAWPRIWNVDAAFRAVLVVLFAGFALAGIYAAAIAVVGQVAAVWGAASVAVLAYPVVRIAMRAATWLVYRDRLDADAAVARLAAVLDADDPRPVAQGVADAAADATGSASVRLVAASVADRAVFEAVAAAPRRDASVAGPCAIHPEAGRGSFPVAFRGELLATLEAAPRPGESELSARDRAALAAIAQHAAPALHGARALREATDAQAALVTAREEERRNLRRELHDDLGPALSGLALGAAALAKRADGVDPAIAEDARDLQADIGDVVARSREISHGLRPPILDLGLEAALRARLGAVADVELEVGDLGSLPAAVELAALRIVQEAVTNVRRHAAASVCCVAVSREDDGLRIVVIDDGVGMPHAVPAGIGLRSIRERAAELGGHARIGASSGGGTLVSVWVPAPDSTEEAG